MESTVHLPFGFSNTGPRILIIEDEKAIAETIRYALSRDGFAPVCCDSGAVGLRELARDPPDLVILDIGLPDCNGFDLFHRIRSTSSVPIIFLTARSDEIDRVVGLEQGADDYVTKPFSPRELTARVRTILRRVQRRPEPTPVPEASATRPFRVDEARRCISYFDTPLSLTRFEYRLLRVLIRRPGRVYSREELLTEVWEEPEDSSDRGVDALIKSLRAKLRAVQPDHDAILTHRGQGYALSEVA